MGIPATTGVRGIHGKPVNVARLKRKARVRKAILIAGISNASKPENIDNDLVSYSVQITGRHEARFGRMLSGRTIPGNNARPAVVCMRCRQQAMLRRVRPLRGGGGVRLPRAQSRRLGAPECRRCGGQCNHKCGRGKARRRAAASRRCGESRPGAPPPRKPPAPRGIGPCRPAESGLQINHTRSVAAAPPPTYLM